jgi:dTDP-4-dehydrorhamnose reductase
MKILVFGGNGLLGSCLKEIDSSIITPTSSQVNIKNFDEVSSEIEKVNPDLVINAAAFIDNRKIEKDPTLAVETNIIGSANISLCCFKKNIRLVYISTDYIYKGDRGNYKETDEILPFNLYAWTKLGGECSTQMVKNNLIIRTSFGSSNFNYKYAFNDKYASKDYVEVIAPRIYEAAISTLIGVLNLGTERKTLFEHAVVKNDQVKPISVTDTYFSTPIDTSLNLQKWINYKSKNPTCQPHTKCRCCNSSDMTKYLDLGVMPLANNLEFTSKLAKQKDRFPLQIMFCNNQD